MPVAAQRRSWPCPPTVVDSYGRHDYIAHDVISVNDMRHDVKRSSIVKGSIAPVEVPRLDSHLCFALYAASNHMTRLFAPFLQKLGVTYPQYLVLVVLWERGPQGVGDLASLLQMEFGTLSPMLKHIESKGLITRQ